MSEKRQRHDPAPQVSAVLLAAGQSRRMGRPKQLLPVKGIPAVRYCAETLLAAGLTDAVVVVGPRGSETEAALGGLPLRIVRNFDPDSDMAGSVRAGLEAVEPSARSILVCLADHPLVLAGTIRAILAESRTHPARIIIPLYRGRRGHPSLFPRSIINEVSRGKNLRDIIGEHAAHVRHVGTDDAGIVLDLDTEEDYQELRRRTGDGP